MYTLGIDVGSASSKVVILKDGKDVVAAEVVQVGTGSSGNRRIFPIRLPPAMAGLRLRRLISRSAKSAVMQKVFTTWYRLRALSLI